MIRLGKARHFILKDQDAFAGLKTACGRRVGVVPGTFNERDVNCLTCRRWLKRSKKKVDKYPRCPTCHRYTDEAPWDTRDGSIFCWGHEDTKWVKNIEWHRCDLCTKTAIWFHPEGGKRCSTCPRPEAT
jgi:hypothetical protein